jgi:hypothetical protein
VQVVLIGAFGRIILNTERESFDMEIERFKRNLKKYYQAALAVLGTVKTDFEDMMVKEYLPRWREHPPSRFARYGLTPTPEILEKELRSICQDLSQKAISLEEPLVRVVYKSIAPESVRDPEFLEPLRMSMRRRGVPVGAIESLFASGDAAPARDSFNTP